MSVDADVRTLRRLLPEVERRARALPWSGQPGDTWTTRAYVRVEDGLPLVDLHDLDRDLALLVCDVLLAHHGELTGDQVRLVTGRGRHSDHGKAVLREIVANRLRAAGWQVDETGPGHLDVGAGGAAVPTRPAVSRGFLAFLLRLLGLFFRRR